jgi:hypothetical protein
MQCGIFLTLAFRGKDLGIIDQANIQTAYKSLVRLYEAERANRVRKLGQKAKNMRILPADMNMDDVALRELLAYLKTRMLSKGPVLKVQISFSGHGAGVLRDHCSILRQLFQ